MHLTSATINHDRFPTRDAYPFDLDILQQSGTLCFPSPVTIFTGENGTGKSTLLKAICQRCNIHIWEGRYRPSHTVNQYANRLNIALDIQWNDGPVSGSFFSPELFRNFRQLVDEWAGSNPGLLDYFGGESLVSQSHGQSCMAYFASIYKVKGLHFLDEPETALSPTTQLALRKLIEEMSVKGHAQFIMATHSPLLMSCSRATLYSFDGQAIEPTTYKATRHYQVYETFFRENA